MTLKGSELVFDPISLTRVVSTEVALDDAVFPGHWIVLRTAPDEALVVDGVADEVRLADEHAIVVDDTGWCGAWFDVPFAETFLRNNSTWKLPEDRPSFSQGMVAEAPVKLWAEAERVLLLVPHVAARDLADRMIR